MHGPRGPVRRYCVSGRQEQAVLAPLASDMESVWTRLSHAIEVKSGHRPSHLT